MALTGKNEIVGTVYYMSPEQLQAQATGKEIDGRSDIFSFGLVLYEMLTGKRAFEGSSPASVIAAIMEREAPSISDVAPASLDRVLKRCLAKKPEERWQSAHDVELALELATIANAATATQRTSVGAWAAIAAPSSTRCGNSPSSTRSFLLAGSPSVPLATTILGPAREATAPATRVLNYKR